MRRALSSVATRSARRELVEAVTATFPDPGDAGRDGAVSGLSNGVAG